jgi:hypothetical protein
MLFLSTDPSDDLTQSFSGENVPRKFLREEVIHPSEADELREGSGQSETVRQPCGLATDSEPSLEETLPKDELTGKTFTGWHIGIVLYPGTPDWVEFSFLDLGLDTFETLWIKLLKPFVLLYGAMVSAEPGASRSPT